MKRIATDDVFITYLADDKTMYMQIQGDKITALEDFNGATVFSMNKGKQKARQLKKQYGNKFGTVTAWPLIKERQEQMKAIQEAIAAAENNIESQTKAEL